MPRLPLRSLRLRVILLILLVLLPAVGAVVHMAVQQQNQAMADARETAARTLTRAADQFDEGLAETRQLLLVLSRLPEVQDRRGPNASRLFRQLVTADVRYTTVVAFTPEGDVFASGVPFRGQLNAAFRPYFQRAIAERTFVLSDFFEGPITGEELIAYAYPVLDEGGRLRGVVSAGLNLGWLQQSARELPLPPRATLSLIHRDGTLLAHVPSAMRPPTEAVRQAVIRQEQGIFEAEGPGGTRRLYAFESLETHAPNGGPFLVIGTPTDVVYAPARAALMQSLLLVGAAGLLVLLLAWFGSNRLVLRPIAKVGAAAERLARGDLSARTGLEGAHGELGHLVGAFDAMAHSLERLEAERRRAEEERLELVLSEQRARAEAEAARQLERVRTDFVNAVSHDLRTPLTSIIGYAEFLEDQIAGPLTAEQLSFVREILKSARRQERLVNDLLDFARLEAGTFTLEPEPADLGEKIRDIAASLRPQVQAAGLSLNLELPEAPVPVVMDPQRIGQVLINLMHNAIKFTPAGGTIRVRLDEDGDVVRVTVADTGIGIAPADVPRLFQRFSRLESAAAKAGTGLGLTISKAIVEAHGGRIGLESEPGHGSTFWFELPRQGPGAGFSAGS